MSIERKTLKIEWSIKSFDEETQEWIIAGHASIFNNIDSYGDRILKGAFKKTIKENAFFKMYYNHEARNLPIGKTLIAKEDEKGLYFEGRISNTSMGRDVYTLVKDKVLDSMSIGYITIQERMTADGIRELKEIKLLEVSVVGFPANTEALITSVKSEELIMAEIAELKNKIAEMQSTNEIAELKSQIAEIKSLLGFDEPDVSTHEEPEADELTQEEIDILQVEIAKLQAQLEEQVKE